MRSAVIPPMHTARGSNDDGPRPPMAPQWVDENPNIESVEVGLRIAVNEKRDLVSQADQQAARRSSEPEIALNDQAVSASEKIPSPSDGDPGGLAPDEVIKP